MKFNQSAGSEFPLQPSGTHPAVLFQIIDLGTQAVEFKGETKNRRQVKLVFELHGDECNLPDGRPMAISRVFTNSGHEKAGLRLFIENWRGKKFTDDELSGFEFKSLLGKACFLNVVHNPQGDTVYANIAGAAKMPTSLPAPEPQNELLYVSLDPEEYDPETFNKLPQKTKEKIWPTREYSVASGVPNGADEPVGEF